MSTRAAPTAEMAARVAELYESGLSLEAVAREVGRSWSWVRSVLIQMDIPRRPVGSSNPGARNGRHKGDGNLTYSGLHRRVRAARGTPKECSVCKTTEDRAYQWANLTGNYEDVWDYARMCVPCHRNYDISRRSQ